MTMYRHYLSGEEAPGTSLSPLHHTGSARELDAVSTENKTQNKTIYCDIFQYTTADIASEGLIDAIRETADEFSIEPISRKQIALARHESHGLMIFENRLRSKDGSTAPVKLHLQVLSDEQGSTQHICGFLQDVVRHTPSTSTSNDNTGELHEQIATLSTRLDRLRAELQHEIGLRMRAEAKLHALEERYHTLVDTNPGIVSINTSVLASNGTATQEGVSVPTDTQPQQQGQTDKHTAWRERIVGEEAA